MGKNSLEFRYDLFENNSKTVFTSAKKIHSFITVLITVHVDGAQLHVRIELRQLTHTHTHWRREENELNFDAST